MLAVLTFAGGAGTGWPLLEHIGFTLFALVVLCYFLIHISVRGLRIAVRVSPARVMAGDAVEETYIFTKESMWPALWIEIASHSFEFGPPGGAIERMAGPSGRLQATVPARGERVVRRTRTVSQRGRYRLGTDSVRVRDPLGFFSRTCRPADTVEIVVYPRPIAIPEATLVAREISTSRQYRRLAEADATHGELREYVPGDPPSRIHWRTSARRGALMIAEPERLQERSIWLVADFGGPVTAVEAVAGVTAHIANSLFRTGSPVGALVLGREIDVIPASRDRGHIGRILEALAGAEAVPRSCLDHAFAAAADCDEPSCFVVVSASPRIHAAVLPLRSLCPQVRMLPVTASTKDMPA